MGIFSSKKKTEEDVKDTEKKVSATTSVSQKESSKNPTRKEVQEDVNLEDVLLRPRITEKASLKMEGNAYVFEIAKDADKNKVKRAFKNIYKIKPRKVNIIKSPSKRIVVRGKRGVKPGMKKAYIYLKEGDKIDIV